MPFVLVIAGLLMVVTGARGTYQQFGSQLAKDFNGQFLYFAAAILFVGALGYVESLRRISRLFMALILIVLVLANRGFFDKFTQALKTGPVAPKANTGGASGYGVSSAGGASSTPSLKQSLQKPGGGGFWDWAGIPQALRPSWAQ